MTNTYSILVTSPAVAYSLRARTPEAEQDQALLNVGMAWVNSRISREQMTQAAQGLAEHWRELDQAPAWHHKIPVGPNDIACPLCGGCVEGARICGGASCRSCDARWYDGNPSALNENTPLPGAAFYAVPTRQQDGR